jgi:hypothetical protein
LGFTPAQGYEMNTCFTTSAETNGLLAWFDSIWNNAEETRDVKAEIIGQLRELFESKSPDLIYFLTLYNIFREFLGELEEDKIIKIPATKLFPDKYSLRMCLATNAPTPSTATVTTRMMTTLMFTLPAECVFTITVSSLSQASGSSSEQPDDDTRHLKSD